MRRTLLTREPGAVLQIDDVAGTLYNTGVYDTPNPEATTDEVALLDPTGTESPASDATPIADGVATAGVLATYSRGDHVHPLVTLFATGLRLGGVVFASLGAPADGTIVYCTDADTPASQGATTTSAGDKAGALVMRIRGAWHSY